MRVNYGEAALRHWDDAEFLSKDERAHNADQLYGLAAECALKCIMVTKLRASAKPDGNITKPYKKHIDQLWDECLMFAAGRSGASYMAPLSGFALNPFKDWSIDQRYSPNTPPPSDEAHTAHRQAAAACLTALQRSEVAP